MSEIIRIAPNLMFAPGPPIQSCREHFALAASIDGTKNVPILCLIVGTTASDFLHEKALDKMGLPHTPGFVITTLKTLVQGAIGFSFGLSCSLAGDLHAAEGWQMDESVRIDDPATVQLPDELHVPKFDDWAEVERIYDRDIKKLFARSCFGCHTRGSPAGAVLKVDFVKARIDAEIESATAVVDMGTEFPFQGKYSTLALLLRLRQSLTSSTMPPLRYLLVRWDSGFSHSELGLINAWVNRGIAVLLKADSED